MQHGLDGKVAVICGGGSGVGRAAAMVLARAGASVVVSARSAAKCAEVAGRINDEGGSAFAMPVDVTDLEQMRRLARGVEKARGSADILVVTAGSVEPVGRTWQVNPADWARSVETNLVGTFNAVQAFLPQMISRRGGVIVLVSSSAVKIGTPTWGAYGASKAGVDFLGRVLQAELDMDEIPIRVHVAYPGVVDTAMQEQIRALPEEQFPSVGIFRKMYEKGRLRPPEQPANLIWWLTTEAAADLKGLVADLDDSTIRERLVSDLQIEPF